MTYTSEMELITLSAQDIAYFYDLYLSECDQTNTHPTLSDFSLWFDENYA